MNDKVAASIAYDPNAQLQAPPSHPSSPTHSSHPEAQTASSNLASRDSVAAAAVTQLGSDLGALNPRTLDSSSLDSGALAKATRATQSNSPQAQKASTSPTSSHPLVPPGPQHAQVTMRRGQLQSESLIQSTSDIPVDNQSDDELGHGLVVDSDGSGREHTLGQGLEQTLTGAPLGVVASSNPHSASLEHRQSYFDDGVRDQIKYLSQQTAPGSGLVSSLAAQSELANRDLASDG